MPDTTDFVEWDDRYLVNIPLIDTQHKELIRLTNDLYQGCLMGDDAARAYFMKTIKSVVDYVAIHFSTEEKILVKIKYPGYEAHKNQHEEFVKKVLEDVKDFGEGKKFVPNLFVRYLKDWIFSHIAMDDKRYSEYIFNLKRKGLLKSAAASSGRQG
ncbi:MAG: bacteriohemerythrin [Treponema sp.]|nr:bacteriohemerythrin [Treponema sp.]